MGDGAKLKKQNYKPLRKKKMGIHFSELGLGKAFLNAILKAPATKEKNR